VPGWTAFASGSSVSRVRSALVLVAFVGLLVAAGASSLTGPEERAIDKIQEAMRLENRAFGLFQDNRSDPEVDELVQRSKELLREAYGLPGLSERVTNELGYALNRDNKFLKERNEDPQSAAISLEIATWEKNAAIRYIEEDSWKATADKTTPAADVSTPTCRSTSATAGIPGCTGLDYWDIYVSSSAKRAKCTFRGPGGEITTGRPLFPGTAQVTSCKLTKRFHVVGGVRKRVVRAELRITVLPGSTVSGTKPVRVTAHWQ